MRTILHNGTFYEVCPHCGLSAIDYAVMAINFPCPACRNGTVKPDEAERYFCGGFHYGARF